MALGSSDELRDYENERSRCANCCATRFLVALTVWKRRHSLRFSYNEAKGASGFHKPFRQGPGDGESPMTGDGGCNR